MITPCSARIYIRFKIRPGTSHESEIRKINKYITRVITFGRPRGRRIVFVVPAQYSGLEKNGRKLRGGIAGEYYYNILLLFIMYESLYNSLERKQ